MKRLIAILSQVSHDSWDIIFKTSHPPRNLTWFVTERCNLHCKHCFVASGNRKPRREMPHKDRVAFLHNADIENITLTGGEPTLYDEFPDLFSQIESKRGVKSITVATNGFRHEIVLDALANRNCSLRYRVQTSLDGPEAVHNEIRGSAKAFSLVVGLLDGVKNIHGIASHAIMTLSKLNVQYLKETIKIANDLGTYLSLNIVRSSSDARASNINDFIPEKGNDLTLNEVKSAIQIWKMTAQPYLHPITRWLEITRLESVVYFMETGCWRFPCAAGMNDAVLYPDGSVAVCETLAPLGNLYDYHLNWKELWKNHRQQFKSCYCQWDCAMLNSLSKSFLGYKALLKAGRNRARIYI